jgi:hypothetical protein
MNVRALKLPAPEPDALSVIGRIKLASVILPYPMSFRDVERDTEWALSQLTAMQLRDDRLSLFISAGAEMAQVWPYENAAQQLGSPLCFAENSPFDAYRVEMFLRRFDIQLVFGVTRAIVQGLIDGGHDLHKVFSAAGHVVAHADAWQLLRAAGVAAWRLVPLGPAYALEPPAGGGVRYDQREWFVEEKQGELLLTSLARRAAPFVRLHTGVSGSVRIDGDTRVIELQP